MTAVIQLGQFERVPLIEAWPTEDGNFTPWLAQADTLGILGGALGMDLDVEAVERSVGPFRADILARVLDDPDHRVVIENQFGRTDHRHLGQILTYLAGIEGAKTVVWIAETIQADHRAAIDWLNTNTADEYSFFAIEIELWRIDASAPAPRFNVISSPNDWSREVRSTTRQLGEGPANDLQRLYLDYWTAYRRFYANREPNIRLPQPRPRAYWKMSLGRTGFQLNSVIVRERRSIRVEAYIQLPGQTPKIAFRQLKDEQGQIEREIGSPLSWEELPTRQASRIAQYKEDADVANRDDWPNQHRWLFERTADFRRVFRERVSNLDLDVPEGEEHNSGELAEELP